jgi:hypothetical protein
MALEAVRFQSTEGSDTVRFSPLLAGALALVAAGAAAAQTSPASTVSALIVTASNTATNQLLVYSSTGALSQTIPTGGQGGAGGNAGGIAQNDERLAVVNFASNSVSVFTKDKVRGALKLESVVPVAAGPVSVALNEDHLYVLTAQSVESHPVDYRGGVSAHSDGDARLVVADGSAAQVGILPGQLIVSEKSNVIEAVSLDGRGAVHGAALKTRNIPANVDAPFGLVTRGFDAYVTIAHANEVSLVRNNAVLTVTGSGTQSAPCWLALDGQFLFSSNSPSHSVSRYVVSGQSIVQAVPVAATFNGNPADIAYAHTGYNNGLAAVVDANATVSHLSIFRVDAAGNLGLQGLATINTPTANGVAIVKLGQR